METSLSAIGSLISIFSLLALAHARPSEASGPRLPRSYGNLPLHFEVNEGQTDEGIKLISRGSGYTLFLTSMETLLALHKPQGEESLESGPSAERGQFRSNVEGNRFKSKRTGKTETAVLRIGLADANSAAERFGHGQVLSDEQTGGCNESKLILDSPRHFGAVANTSGSTSRGQ